MAGSHWLTRFVFFRLLGLVYTVAFSIVVFQWPPLLESDGLLPAARFLDAVGEDHGRGASTFLRLPTLFWLDASDASFRAGGYVGLGLSVLVLCGLANVPILFALWLLYMSFVHVGQIFYGYGWELLLLETGFLAIFLAPLWNPAPFPRRAPPSPVVIVLLRWLAFRLMLGAGLIKLRGDPCWRDLTCLVFHYETQPNPNPLSWYFHQAPVWFHELEVVFNHVVELVAPLFVFGPSWPRRVAGGLIVVFQVLLILSGNLSFLNWLTIAVAVDEIVLEGTDDDPNDAAARWAEYDFKCKPGTPERRPCWISPYHYRLDWQMWFQDMPGTPIEAWFVHLIAKLLDGDRAARALLAPGPFEDHPPRALRARYYRHALTRRGEPTRAWWKRTLVGEYLSPLTRDDPRLLGVRIP